MNIYRLAELNIAYMPRTAYAASLLAPYRTEDGDAALTITLPLCAIQEEHERLPAADEGVLEMTALLRSVSHRLTAFDRLVLHAATVVMDGRAYAFIAPSGTGKTTQAQLWEGDFPDRVTILNGDRLVVHIRPDGVTAFGNPWRGREALGENACAPLRGLFVLSRSECARCDRLSPSDALPSLLRATVYPTAAPERETVLALLEQLTQAVPLYRLYAPLSPAAVEAALTQLGE